MTTTTTTEKKREKPKGRDPESAFYDTVKRKRVRVTLTSLAPTGGHVLFGVLEWVATYSIGLLVDGEEKTTLVAKGQVSTLQLAE